MPEVEKAVGFGVVGFFFLFFADLTATLLVPVMLPFRPIKRLRGFFARLDGDLDLDFNFFLQGVAGGLGVGGGARRSAKLGDFGLSPSFC